MTKQNQKSLFSSLPFNLYKATKIEAGKVIRLQQYRPEVEKRKTHGLVLCHGSVLDLNSLSWYPFYPYSRSDTTQFF